MNRAESQINKIGNIETKIKKLTNKVGQLKKQFEEISNEENGIKTLTGNFNIHTVNYNNIQVAESENIVLPNNKEVYVKWDNLIVNRSDNDVFGGIEDNNFTINYCEKNTIYEFVINVDWKVNIKGYRSVSLVDPSNRIYNSTIIPRTILQDYDGNYKSQVIFKVDSTTKGGWKVLLHQDSGVELSANIKMKVLGPFTY